jgi:superfamily II DNA or RNA helicase
MMPPLVWPEANQPLQPIPRATTLDPGAITLWLVELGVGYFDLDGLADVIRSAQASNHPFWLASATAPLRRSPHTPFDPADAHLTAQGLRRGRAKDGSLTRRQRQQAQRDVAAVALCLAWQAPALRDRLRLRPWRRVALNLDLAERAQDARRAPRDGWLRLVLSHAQSTTATVQLILQARHGAHMLKPKKVPAADPITAYLEAPKPAERDAWALQQCIRQSQPCCCHHSPAAEAWMRPLIDLAPELHEVFDEDGPLEVLDLPWSPNLELLDGDDGVLSQPDALPDVWWPLGRGWARFQRSLRPLAEGVRPWLEAFEAEGPLHIPLTEVPRFVDEVLTRSALPVHNQSTQVRTQSCPPQPRLLLEYVGDETLSVDVRFRYHDLDLTSIHGAVVATDQGLLRRQLDVEAAQRREVERAVGALPGVLEGDAAWAFLRDVHAGFPHWHIEADKGLLDRVPTASTPLVQFYKGLGWFKINVKLFTDRHRISLEQVIEAWRTQRQFVVLEDGAVAELPGLWMARHGPALAAAQELSDVDGGHLSGASAAILGELLEEAETEDAAAAEALTLWRQLGAKIQASEGVPQRAPPPLLNATLRDYQHRGYRWLCHLRTLGMGAVLADDMGLGKTLQTLATLLDGRADAEAPDLVVAPTSVVHNWALEAARFTPSLRVYVHHGAHRGEPPEEVDLILTTWPLLRRDHARLDRRWNTVVLDEAQAIKNPRSQTTRIAWRLEARFRIALSGTPMENHLLELWSLMRFAVPGLFGSRDAFFEHYAKPVAEGREDAAERLAELRVRIRPFVLRRLKAEVAPELPPRQEQVLKVQLEARQRALYDRLRDAYCLQLERERDHAGRRRLLVFEALLRLRQAACEPSLIPLSDAQAIGCSAKRALLRDLLPSLHRAGHRTLVFSQWPSVLKRVAGDLDAAGLGYLSLDGSTKERATLQARWNDPAGPPVFLISLRAGGTGLNLVAADHVIHLDPWWNPAVEQQATDRAHRIGQKNPVMVYRLIAEDTLEETICELQSRKQTLFDATVNAERPLVNQLGRADYEAIFGVPPSAANPGLLAPQPEAALLETPKRNAQSALRACVP